MTNKKVSVIIPCFNAEKYLSATLESVLKQTYSNYEIILVDDGSTDNTPNILSEFAGKYTNIKVITQSNGGVSKARNVAIDNASGEYFVFVDSDDLITKDYLQTLVENLERYNADLSICNFKRLKENQVYKDKSKHKTKIYEGLDITRELFRQKTFEICAWNRLFKKEVVGDLRFSEDVRYGEDLGFNYYYFTKCKKAVFDEKICYLYIRRETGLVNSKLNNNKLSVFIEIERFIKDSQINFPELVCYTKGWKALASVDFIYQIYKSDYSDSKVINYMIQNLKDGTPYLKECKKMVWHRRHLVPLVYFLACILLKNKRCGGGS